jgi:hypothetical protein
MLQLLRKLWTKASVRRAKTTARTARREGLNVEPLETRSMLSAMPLNSDGTYDFIMGHEVDRPTVLPVLRQVSINRPIGSLPVEFGRIVDSPSQAEWPNLTLPANLGNKISGGLDQGGFVRNFGTNLIFSSAQSATYQQQPAIEQEAAEVRRLLSGLSFGADEAQQQQPLVTRQADLASPLADMVSPKFEPVTPKIELLKPKFEGVTSKIELTAPRVELAAPKIDAAAPKLEKAEPLASPVAREKTTAKPESAATRASGISQPLVQFVDDAEGGMVTLGYHKVADQSAMLTATSAASVESILDRAVQFDRAYGTFQAFEVSSGEAQVQSPAAAPASSAPAAKPVGTTSEQIYQSESNEAKPAIGGISYLPALDALMSGLGASAPSTHILGTDAKLDAACVDAVFAMGATEEQYEQTIGNSSLLQVIAAIAVAAVFYQAQAARAAEPDETAGALPAKSPSAK